MIADEALTGAMSTNRLERTGRGGMDMQDLRFLAVAVVDPVEILAGQLGRDPLWPQQVDPRAQFKLFRRVKAITAEAKGQACSIRLSAVWLPK